MKKLDFGARLVVLVLALQVVMFGIAWLSFMNTAYNVPSYFIGMLIAIFQLLIIVKTETFRKAAVRSAIAVLPALILTILNALVVDHFRLRLRGPEFIFDRIYDCFLSVSVFDLFGFAALVLPTALVLRLIEPRREVIVAASGNDEALVGKQVERSA